MTRPCAILSAVSRRSDSSQRPTCCRPAVRQTAPPSTRHWRTVSCRVGGARMLTHGSSRTHRMPLGHSRQGCFPQFPCWRCRRTTARAPAGTRHGIPGPVTRPTAGLSPLRDEQRTRLTRPERPTKRAGPTMPARLSMQTPTTSQPVPRYSPRLPRSSSRDRVPATGVGVTTGSRRGISPVQIRDPGSSGLAWTPSTRKQPSA